MAGDVTQAVALRGETFDDPKRFRWWPTVTPGGES
jgi:hypothetical protein